MPGLADPPKFAFPKAHMTVAEADAVHAYVIDQAWKAYKGERELRAPGTKTRSYCTTLRRTIIKQAI